MPVTLSSLMEGSGEGAIKLAKNYKRKNRIELALPKKVSALNNNL